ncbi:MAG: two-component regulator propeller domain-containing protein [Bacteroidota bacterium]
MKRILTLRLIAVSLLGMVCFLPDLQAQFPLFSTVAGKDQLNGGKVSRVLQDNNGLVWIGSNRGLFVYDGFDFSEAGLPDSLNLQDVTSLAIDHSGRIWAGFGNGSIAFGRESGFIRFGPAEGLPVVPVTALLFEPDGTLWIATYGEGLYYNKGNRLFNINTDDGLGDNYVYTLARLSDGTIWAGNDAGISVCRSKDSPGVINHYSTHDGLPDILVQAIIPSESGGLWIGMQEKGVCYFNPQKKVFEFPAGETWPHGQVNDILEFGNLLWVATEGDGLIELSIHEGNNAGRSMAEVTGRRTGRMLHDREGNVWLIASGSLLWSSGPGIRHYKSSGDFMLGNIHAIHAEEDGSFWFGNDKGLFRYGQGSGGQGTLTHLLPPQSRGGPGITSIYHDPFGKMWIGTFGNGLYCLGEGNKDLKRVKDPKGLLNDNILAISGRGEEIWLATLGGAARFNARADKYGKFRFDQFPSGEGPGNNFIYTVLADGGGRIWFGTDGKGPAMYEKGRFTGYGPSQGMKSRVIYSVTEDSDRNLWFSSAGEGIYRYDGKKFTNFNLKSGLRDLKITSVISSAQNQVVVVHNQGVDVINSRTGQVSYLGMRAGITNINPDLNAVASDSSGSVWIGTRDGIIHYTPEYINAMAMPLTSVRRVSVYLSDEEALPGAVFPHNRNHLSFSYIGVWLSNPETVTYRVKLEGNDPDWISTGERVTNYSNLRPGKYTFRVQSSVNNDFTFAREATFSFTIRSPLYTRWWFVLGAGLLIFLIARSLLTGRLNRIRREQQLLKEKAESQFQMLKSQVNPHFLFNNFSTLMAIIEEDKDLAIEYVGKLSAFFRYILEYRDTDLIPLSEELEIVDNYLFLQRKRYGDNLTVQKEIHPEHLISFIPPLTLQLLLENAVKHNVVSVTKPLNIRIFSDADSLVIENSLQPRKTPEPSTGMGLQNIISRYRIFTKNEVKIVQTETLFSISLPMIFSKTKKP